MPPSPSRSPARLQEYKAKRDFHRTKEPAGKVEPDHRTGEPLFVVQKHDATRLHYDFRLEMEGVLKSWAVPKGFPTRKGDRRLAVQVEDHPFDYAKFEGTIPEASYGGGTVMVWDIGTFEISGPDPLTALRQGKLQLTLKGKKLKGEWTLVRMRQRDNEAKPQWLLLKSAEDIPEFSERAENHSALTGRSLAQIAKARDWEWTSEGPAFRSPTARSPLKGSSPSSRRGAGRQLERPSTEITKTRRSKGVSQQRKLEPLSIATQLPEINLRRLPKAAPAFVEPMKALLVEELPEGPEWTYELKFDGVRALAIKRSRKISLVSRSAKDLSSKYPELVEALNNLPATQATLDGEIVAVDAEGRSSFQLLQSYNTPGGKKPPLFYYAFDLINLDGKDLAALPLEQRKAMAEALVKPAAPVVRFSAGIKADSARVVREMQARGLEGLIAKQKDSKYESGRRSGAWVKFKWTMEQEFVIGGYTQPEGARTNFGAILVGYYESAKFLFAGKVGTGFDHALLASLHQMFKKLVRPVCPFANLPEKIPGARGKGLTAAKMKSCTWLEPKLVCEVRFAEWTRDNHLRQPAFLGLREDKSPREVVREKPA